MSEPRIVNIIEFLDRSSRVINLKIRLRMTALQFGIRHSTNKPDALQNHTCRPNRGGVELHCTSTDYYSQNIYPSCLNVFLTVLKLFVLKL